MSTIRWLNTLGGDWNRASNWDYGADPTASDDALFNLAGAYTVSISTPATAGDITFNAAGATLDETGGSLTVTDDLSVYNGLVSLNTANSIGSEVLLSGGVLAVGNSGGLGGASVIFSGGELLGTSTETLANSLLFSGVTTTAAATGQTLTLTGGAYLDGPTTLTFGAPGANGTVVWNANGFQLQGASQYSLDVAAGALVFGYYDGLGITSQAWNSLDVQSGATLDLNGSSSNFDELIGGGTLTASHQSSLIIGGGNFSGNLTGDLSLDITGQVDLAGSSTVESVIFGNGNPTATLTNEVGGVFTLDEDGEIAPQSGGLNDYFVNDGAFVRSGSPGGNLVSVPFYNFGTMQIIAATMTFTDGFDNGGIIEGLMSTSGGNVTLSPDNPANPTYYGGSGNDVFDLTAAPHLVQAVAGTNTIDVEASMTFAANSVVNVQRYVIENGVTANLSHLIGSATIVMNAAGGGSASVYGTQGADTIIGGSGVDTVDFSIVHGSATITHNANGTVTIGTAEGVDTLSHVDWAQFADQRVWIGPVHNDFNGAGKSGILWRNTNGDTLIWNANGSGGFNNLDLGVVSSSYQVAGTGDFNGDGEADILWRNTSGDALIWNSNGSGEFTGQDFGVVDPNYQAAGIGDFNGDGKSDILWRNTVTGDAFLWNSNGAGGFTGQDFGVVDPNYQAAGIGDFNGDGKSDILWRNTVTGDAFLWNSNSSGGFTGEDLGVVDPNYQVAGVADFNGDGKSDILWRNAVTGDAFLWNSNGSGEFSDEDLGVVSTSYQVAEVGDFNGDGKADILWRNTATGDAFLWDSNGSGGFTGHDLGVVASSWTVQHT